MAALLIAEQVSQEVLSLNSQLRDKTLRYSQSKFSVVVPKYTPWLCFAPVVDDLPTSLLSDAFSLKGRLLDTELEVESLAKFIAGPGQACLVGLPGDKNDWIPKLHKVSSRFEKSIDIIENSCPALKQLYREIVDVVVPLGGGRNRGYSTHFARGAIFRSLPNDNNEYDVALDVVHELGHQVLMVWQSVDPILASEPDAPIYSQIRKCDRPAIQSFHATVALAYMLFLKQNSEDDQMMLDAAARRGSSYSLSLENSLELAISSIKENCDLTDLGTVLLSEMEALI